MLSKYVLREHLYIKEPGGDSEIPGVGPLTKLWRIRYPESDGFIAPVPGHCDESSARISASTTCVIDVIRTNSSWLHTRAEYLVR